MDATPRVIQFLSREFLFTKENLTARIASEARGHLMKSTESLGDQLSDVETFHSHQTKWSEYVNDNLIPMIKSLGAELEGNIYSSHLTFVENVEMQDKQNNFYQLISRTKPKTVLEIGFNAGFSCLFMKMVLPSIEMTCVDLNEHTYVMPCFNRINQDFDKLRIITGSSYDVGLPQLIEKNEKFDLIHIDGDHRQKGARKDLDLCLKLCHDKTIIVFDDTNIPHLDKLCNKYIRKGLVKEYHLDGFRNSQKYKHRLLQINNNPKSMLKKLLNW